MVLMLWSGSGIFWSFSQSSATLQKSWNVWRGLATFQLIIGILFACHDYKKLIYNVPDLIINE